MSQDEVVEIHERLSALVDVLPDMIFVLDEEGRYVEILSSDQNLLYASIIKSPREIDARGTILRTEADFFLEAIQQAIETRRDADY